MIYRYSLHGKLHESGRAVSYAASIPLGLTQEELRNRIDAFSKAVKLDKLVINY